MWQHLKEHPPPLFGRLVRCSTHGHSFTRLRNFQDDLLSESSLMMLILKSWQELCSLDQPGSMKMNITFKNCCRSTSHKQLYTSQMKMDTSYYIRQCIHQYISLSIVIQYTNLILRSSHCPVLCENGERRPVSSLHR